MFTKLIIALYAVGLTAVSAGATPSNVPGCVSKCWDNTQYVSTCAGDNKCLCDDAEFQNAVFQCLYSQCPTALFGSALHHTLSMCSANERKADAPSAPMTTAPALLRQEGLRKVKRQMPMQSVSASVSASVRTTFTRTQSVNRPTMSVTMSAYNGVPTQRAQNNGNSGNGNNGNGNGNNGNNGNGNDNGNNGNDWKNKGVAYGNNQNNGNSWNSQNGQGHSQSNQNSHNNNNQWNNHKA